MRLMVQNSNFSPSPQSKKKKKNIKLILTKHQIIYLFL